MPDEQPVTKTVFVFTGAVFMGSYSARILKPWKHFFQGLEIDPSSAVGYSLRLWKPSSCKGFTHGEYSFDRRTVGR
jgi:hypothetical protein